MIQWDGTPIISSDPGPAARARRCSAGVPLDDGHGAATREKTREQTVTLPSLAPRNLAIFYQRSNVLTIGQLDNFKLTTGQAAPGSVDSGGLGPG